MTNYEYAYRLQEAPEGRTDGSGYLNHDIWKIYREVDSGVAWADAPDVPGRHSTFVVLATDITTVMDMPDSNASEKQAKNMAYKDLLSNSIDNVAEANIGWEDEECTDTLNNNTLAETEAGRVGDYITVTLGQDFPVEFVL